MGKMKEIFIDIMNKNQGEGEDYDYQYEQYLLNYQYEQYLLKQNKNKRDNLRKSLEQDVSDKQVNTVLSNIKLK